MRTCKNFLFNFAELDVLKSFFSYVSFFLLSKVFIPHTWKRIELLGISLIRLLSFFASQFRISTSVSKEHAPRTDISLILEQFRRTEW